MQAIPKFHDVNLSALPPLGDTMFGQLNQLREHDPLYWSETSHCWIVLGHAEIIEGFSGNLPLSNASLPDRLSPATRPADKQNRWPNTVRYMPRAVTNADGPEHARLRKLFVKAFNRKLVEDLRPYVRERVGELLDAADGGQEIEFNEQIARMLPGSVILRLLGMSPDYLARLEEWDDAVATALMSFDPKDEWLDRLETAVTDMVEVFGREIEARRAEPKADLISLLLNAVEDGERLSMDEMLGALILVIIAGHDSTANSITLGVRALAKHPDAWIYWREHPENSVTYAVELMRYVAMSASMPRIVSTDFEWRGRRLKQGQIVMLMMAAGNRDPLVYSQPEKLDLARANDMALTFAPGLHHCIGHLLAKLQLGEFFNALVARFDTAEVLQEPRFTEALVFRGVTALRMRFRPRRVS